MAWRGTLWTTILLLWAAHASAIDRIVLEVDEISMAGTRVSGAALDLDLTSRAPTMVAKAQRFELTQPRIALSDIALECADLVIKEPSFACKRARVAAVVGTAGTITLQAAAGYDTSQKTLSAEGHLENTRIAQVRKLIAPWVSLPGTYSIDGRVDADVKALRRSGALQLQLDARTSDLNFSNEGGTIVAEKLASRVKATARQTGKGLEIAGMLESGAGQVLAGPVLLDFGANPLQLDVRGRMLDQTLQLDEISIAQKNLLISHGQAQMRFGASPTIAHARMDIASVQFPAAYTSFLQIALAATDFGTLAASGTASGAIEIENDRLARIDAQIDNLDLKDDQTLFSMSDLRGALHWIAGTDASVEPSHLAWSEAHAYGLSGGAAQLDFRAHGFGFELIREARVPVFDGAVVMHALAARNVGSSEAELDFDAHIEPISMPLLSKAFGWPELSGQLAGRIPGLTYRSHVLALNGDLTANVFDGTITGRNFRLRDPLGPWPRLYADITARRLDLELVTRTFSIGSITGRMDADLKGLELFDWSPVAFDAQLYSTPADRSKKLISQKAVTSISSIGGGAGGVTKALQSGVLRFFDQFRYDRIGINCQLRNEVCLMTGVEPRGDGYYIVKGRGIPRIDIIGNSGRVDWPRLVTQIVQGMRSENVIVH